MLLAKQTFLRQLLLQTLDKDLLHLETLFSEHGRRNKFAVQPDLIWVFNENNTDDKAI